MRNPVEEGFATIYTGQQELVNAVYDFGNLYAGVHNYKKKWDKRRGRNSEDEEEENEGEEAEDGDQNQDDGGKGSKRKKTKN